MTRRCSPMRSGTARSAATTRCNITFRPGTVASATEVRRCLCGRRHGTDRRLGSAVERDGGQSGISLPDHFLRQDAYELLLGLQPQQHAVCALPQAASGALGMLTAGRQAPRNACKLPAREACLLWVAIQWVLPRTDGVYTPGRGAAHAHRLHHPGDRP